MCMFDFRWLICSFHCAFPPSFTSVRNDYRDFNCLRQQENARICIVLNVNKLYTSVCITQETQEDIETNEMWISEIRLKTLSKEFLEVFYPQSYPP